MNRLRVFGVDDADEYHPPDREWWQQHSADLEAASEERERALAALRACAVHLGNGSRIAVTASIDFHCQVPREVMRVVERLTIERDAALARIAELEEQLVELGVDESE